MGKRTKIANVSLSAYSISASAKADLQSKHQFTGLMPLYIKPFLYISAKALVSEDSILESIVK